MFYIHQTNCISPQTFADADMECLNAPVNNQMLLIEPAYKNIPAGLLRRMSKTVKVGIAAAMPLLENTTVKGIIIGTANGGMDESIKFLNQMVDYNEGLLTPGDFVQSTANAVASQLSLMTVNKSYNSTHVHRGFSFENALLDAAMHIKENPFDNFLVGGLDVISYYNYNIDTLAGCYKKEPLTVNEFYNTNTAGTLAGEGAAMFIVNGISANAVACVDAIEIFHSKDEEEVKQRLALFLKKHVRENEIDLLLSGEDGDCRSAKFYNGAASLFSNVSIARFKHLTGDYATVSAVALWIACRVFQNQKVASRLIKESSAATGTATKKILLYNAYRQAQHSFILVSKVK